MPIPKGLLLLPCSVFVDLQMTALVSALSIKPMTKEAAWLVGCTACFYGVSRDRTFELGKMGKQIGLLSSHITVTAARSNPYLSPPLGSCWLKCLMGNSFHPHDV